MSTLNRFYQHYIDYMHRFGRCPICHYQLVQPDLCETCGTSAEIALRAAKSDLLGVRGEYD